MSQMLCPQHRLTAIAAVAFMASVMASPASWAAEPETPPDAPAAPAEAPDAPAGAPEAPTEPAAAPEAPPAAPAAPAAAPAAPAAPAAAPAAPAPAKPAPATTPAEPGEPKVNIVKTVKDERGWRLMVDGEPLMVFGMNWGYIPIGENYAFVLWHQPEDVIEEALKREMGLLKAMGVNAIRQYPDIPPKWVTWIYENYGIYTVVNHTTGRYGMLVNGTWISNTDYADPETRKAIIAETDAVIEKYKDTPGLLMYLLGNENNYGLTWTSFEAENLPGEQASSAQAEPLYTLFGELATRIKKADPHHPIALANGDLAYLDLIAKHCQDVDIMGSNVYRGVSSRDLFDRVDKEFDRPFMYSEFGADAFDARRKKEDGESQAYYLRGQWEEIYLHAYGQGRSGTAIGGLIFQWTDGWWKHGQSIRLSEQDPTASWATGAYPHDFVPGENNMNEEWFGIAAKDFPDDRYQFEIRPRSAYYMLQEAFTLDPYAPDTTPEKIREHFGKLEITRFAPFYKADRADSRATALERVQLSRLELRMDAAFSAGDERTERPGRLLSDHTESVYFDVTAKPTNDIKARTSFNLVGNVARNRLNDIFYESRGRDLSVTGADGEEVALDGLERIALYQAELEIDQPWFRIEGFYRTGHYHWGDEGDFFGLYREANYGENIDIYNGKAPFGAEIELRKSLEGLKVAFGPEMYWGANPGFIAKYHRKMGAFEFALMHQEDLGRNAASESSLAIPERQTRKTTLHLGLTTGKVRLDIGAVMAGSDRVGESFRSTIETDTRGYRDSGQAVQQDEITWIDTLGAKARVELRAGAFQAYAHGVVKGLVADAGADPRHRFTGWTLNESGRGNQVGGLLGMAYTIGKLQIAPHVLYQKPLVGPIEPIPDYFSRETGIYYPGIPARNFLDDPFAVLDNRETIAGELLFVFDPTPGTWFWQWDNPTREDAGFAASLDIVYWHHPTVRDANFGVNDLGYFFAFGGSPPAEDLWEVKSRFVANPNQEVRLIGNLYVGKAQSSGDDPRLINRYGGDITALMMPIALKLGAKFNDWGPYDYHRDFNLTYPFQGNADIGYVMGLRALDEAMAKFGVRGLVRTLDEHSPEFVALPDDGPGATGLEWELVTYLHLDLL